MTKFEKQVVGFAEAILSIDCGATCGGNWRLPCQPCIEREGKLREELRLVIQTEEVRRHRALGHDKRDGNKMRHKQGQYAGRTG